GSAWPTVNLEPTEAVEVTLGPFRVFPKRELCWNIRARAGGHHHAVFHVDDQNVDKELAFGDGFMRVSMERPGWAWSDAILHPWERPFGPDSKVQSIAIKYPRRESWTSGSDSWVIYWFAVSLVAAFCCRKMLGVSI